MKYTFLLILLSFLLAGCNLLNKEYSIKNESSYTVTITHGSKGNWKEFTIEPGDYKTVISSKDPFTFYCSPISEVYSEEGDPWNSHDFYIYNRPNIY